MQGGVGGREIFGNYLPRRLPRDFSSQAGWLVVGFGPTMPFDSSRNLFPF
jgi:hypothetical protein